MHNTVTKLNAPHESMAPKVFSMVYGDIDRHLPARFLSLGANSPQDLRPHECTTDEEKAGGTPHDI